MLDQVGELECHVTPAGILEVDQPDSIAVPLEAGEVAVGVTQYRIGVSRERHVQR